MKKLLFVAALMALGAISFGAEPAKDDKTTVDVEVRAKIIDSSLSITDIYGNPLILDFKEVPKRANVLKKASVRYKVSTDTPITKNSITLAMELGKGTEEKVQGGEGIIVPIHIGKSTAVEETLKPVLTLDSKEKKILQNQTECEGVIFGVIEESTENKATGDYVGYTSLTATVSAVDPENLP